MEILSLSLTNFKSHQDLYLEFEPGSNAICGENGAGKTSILEAIAWTLFNYSQYQKDELIRKGSKSAQVIVQFISNRDRRTYQVKRCTRRGYELYDPQIGCKLEPTKVEDVVLWLQEHLGVPHDTDLVKLFSEVIGIPQGTFTIDFLKTPEKRKQVFDPILRVEDYKKAFDKSGALEKFSEVEVVTCQQHLERYEIQLQDWEQVKQRHQELTAEIEQREAEKKIAFQRINILENRQKKLIADHEKVEQVNQELQELESGWQILSQERGYLQKSCEDAQQSVRLCETNLLSYQGYQQAEVRLKELDQDRQTQQQLLRKRDQSLQQLQKREKDLAKLELQQENSQLAQRRIAELSPLVQEQEMLEGQYQEVQSKLEQVRTWKWEQEQAEQRLNDCLRRLNDVKQEGDRLKSLEASVAQIPQLEQHYQRYQEQLSRVAAARQFAAQIAGLVELGEQQDGYYQQLQGVLPTLDLKIQQLIKGSRMYQQEMLTRLYQMQSDLSQQVGVEQLQETCESLKSQLEMAYQCQVQLRSWEEKQQEELQLKQEAQGWRSRVIDLGTKIEIEADLNLQMKTLGDRLQHLQNPKGHIQVLQQQLVYRSEIEEQGKKITEIIIEIQQAIADLDQQLSVFSTVDEDIATQRQIKQQHHDGYLVYLQSQKEAATLGDRQQKLQQITAKIAQLETRKQQKKTELDQLYTLYSPEDLKQIQQEIKDLENRLAQLETLLSVYRQKLTEICQDLVKKGEIAQKRDQTYLALEKAKQAYQFIKDSRSFFNQASPRITKFYLGEISQEADSLFRELMNRQNVALEWTEDYDILIQEEGYKRNFKSLSGGEQMCAALAVRLALLRTLADLDIAFFDEPTTNMDRSRRQQLAEAIGNLKSFRQLFVISHDDTFENMSNLIHIQRP